jgi:hypothetical protein
MADCEICRSNLLRVDNTDWAHAGRECPRCGQYWIDTVSDGLRGEVPWFGETETEKVGRLSGWVRESNATGMIPTLTNEVVNRVIARPRPGLRSRSMTVLRELANMEGGLVGGMFEYRKITGDAKLQATTYSLNAPELNVLLQLLEWEGLITPAGSHIGFTVSVQGILAVEKMAATGGEFTQGFVAMWFNPELDTAWMNGFEPAIRNAGFRPFRIDKKEYVGGITDEIISEIRRSRFVVADYTEQVNGVYFEAGFALGLGLTVIPTCRKDHLNKLHFDIQHLNPLPWTSPEDLALDLTKRIVAVVGTGPVVQSVK